MRNVEKLPDNLPIPDDDGLARHLEGQEIPRIALRSTTGSDVPLQEIFRLPTVLFIYPRAGSPMTPNPNTEAWDLIPGARGCTPQTCGYRDLHWEFLNLNVQVLGLSVQSPEVQKEFVERLHIPFQILSDEKHELTNALKLPTFEFEGERLIKRMAFFVRDCKIQKVFYPVFPPDKNASEVIEWIDQEFRKSN